MIALLLPALGQARDSVRTTQCLSNQRAITGAISQYAADFNDWIIPGWVQANSANDFYAPGHKQLAGPNYWNALPSDTIYLGQYTNNTIS